MNAFSFDKNQDRRIWIREQSLREQLKKCYQLGFETGYELGFKQCLKELDEMDNDATSECTGKPYANTQKALQEAEQILREKSND